MPEVPSLGRAVAKVRPVTRRIARTTLVRTIARIPHYVRLLGGTLRDHRVSKIDRAFVVAAIAYVISPFDFIPDFIPFLGQVDDVFLIALALNRLFERAPRDVILAHWDGRPDELSLRSLKRVLTAATFFLPPRVRTRLRRMVKGNQMGDGRWEK